MNSNAPVFVVASVRSGSTMLKLMLDHHPDIVNPGECDFLFDQVGDTGEMPDLLDYQNSLRLNRIYQAKNLKLDISLSYPGVMASFIEQLDGDQKQLTMNVHRHFHRIPFVFPGARYIHLNRDPRDVARSCVSLGWAGHVYHGVDIWREAQYSWGRLKKNLETHQYLEIKYEELLDDVEAKLTEICSFLGLSYSKKMLSYPESTSYKLPDKKLCYQWKVKLGKSEIQLVEGKIGNEIVGDGYVLSEFEPVIPGLLGRFILKLKSRIKRSSYQIRKYGAKLHLLTIVANRLGLSWLQVICQKQRNEVDRLHLK